MSRTPFVGATDDQTRSSRRLSQLGVLMMGTTHLVFTYGTLKRGHGNHRLLADSRFVSLAMTWNKFHMTCVGFPIAWKRGPDMRMVIGEVYEVDDAVLARLDRLEGVPTHYQRERVRVSYLGAGSQTVWMYVQSPRYGHHGRPVRTNSNAYDWDGR